MATWIDQIICAFLNERRKRFLNPNTLPADCLGYQWTTEGVGQAWDLDSGRRLRHVYVLGSTGCGKTNLLSQIVERDVDAKATVAVLDMRGDLIDKILSSVAGKIDHDRVHLIDLRRPELSLGLNPFQYGNDPYSAALQIHGILRAAADSWGVQLDETLRCSLIALSYARKALTDLAELLTNSAFRQSVLSGVDDAYVKEFFRRFDALSPDKQSQWVLPVLNKVSAFLSHPTVRSILAEKRPIDLPAVLDTPGSILLIALGTDRLHSLAGTFGCLAVSAIENCAMKRVDCLESQRNPVHLYLDEFENFQSPAFEKIIAEGRRFRLGLTLSHQNLHQLDSRLRHVIMNNAGTRIYFRTGLSDATELGRELSNSGIDEPVKALLRLPTGHAYVCGEAVEARHIAFRKATSHVASKSDLNELSEDFKRRSQSPGTQSDKLDGRIKHVRRPRAARRKRSES